MQFEKPLPPIRKLKKLAEWDGPFPMKSYRLVIGAMRYGFDEETIQFLQLFPRDEVFNTRDDFVQSCLTLEQSIILNREHIDSEKVASDPHNKDVVHATFHLIAGVRSSIAGLGNSARDENWYL